MSDSYTGEIRMFAGSFAPSGWAFCDGRSLPVPQYQALYAVIGNIYGGNTTDFNIPDLRGRIPVGQGTGIGISSKTIGEKSGAETVVLTQAQLPQHTHAIVISNAAGTAASPQDALWAGNVDQYSVIDSAPDGQMNTEAITITGGNPPQGHSNMMPFLSVSFIIALYGDYFPTQN